jgi:hypothetical protein
VKYDNLLKTIFYDAMPAFIRLLGCSPISEYLNIEFPARPKMVADVVARLADGRILHIEFQLKNDPRMHWRCFHYFGAIQEQNEGSEVIQFVIYIGNSPVQMKREIVSPSLNYHYEIVDMRDLDPDIFLASPNDVERVLALLCQSPEPRTTIRRVLRSWKSLSGKELLENVDRLRTLSHLRKLETIAIEEISQMPFDLDITESVTFKMGEERGEERGEKRGEKRGKVKLLTRQLKNRFGPLPESIHKQLTDASTKQLEDWAIRLLRAQSLDDIFIG